MESSITMLQNAFSQYSTGKFGESLEILQKFKQIKESDSNQQMAQINENILLCEYNQNRMTGFQLVVPKLDELLDEVKQHNNNENVQKTQKKVKSEEFDQNWHLIDNLVMNYNKAVILYFSGRLWQAQNVLKKLFLERKSQDQFIQMRIGLLLFELSILVEDIGTAVSIYNLMKQEDYFQFLQDEPFTQKLLKDDNDQQQLIQKNKCTFFHSLLFGSEIYAHNETPQCVSQKELSYLDAYMRMKLILQSEGSNYLEQRGKDFQLFLESGESEYENKQAHFKGDLNLALKVHTAVSSILIQAHHLYKNSVDMSECLRILNFSSIPDLSQRSSEYDVLQFNNLGCIHMKMEKYSLAIHYFHKAIKAFQTQHQNAKYETVIQQNIKAKFNYIYLNLADTLYQSGKYQQALAIYNKLQEFCSHNSRFWYNRGVCLVNIYQDSLKDKRSKNDLYDVLDESLPRYSFEKPKQQAGKGSRTIETESEPDEEGATRRLIINQKEIHSDMDEDISSDPTQPQMSYSQKKESKWESAQFQQDRGSKELLQQSAKSFRNSLMIQRREKLEKKQEFYLYDHKVQSRKDEKQAIVINKAGNQNLYESTVVFLAYVLLSRGDFNQSLQVAKDGMEQNFSEENKFILLQYVMENYLESNRLKEVTAYVQSQPIQLFISKQVNSSQNSMQVRNTVGMQNAHFKQLQNKGIFYFNLTVLHLHNSNTTVAQNSINQMLQAFDLNIYQSQSNIPVPVLNLLIWFNLKTENVQNALQLLRRRRILNGPIGKNKIQLLRITK